MEFGIDKKELTPTLNATQLYVGVAVFRMGNSSLAHASMLNCYTIILKQINPCSL